MPGLSGFICSMQKHEEESHLAIQTTKELEDERKKTTCILWLDDSEENCTDVKVTNEIIKPAENKNDNGIIIQIRVMFYRDNNII